MKIFLAMLGMLILTSSANAELGQGPTKWYCMATCKFVEHRGQIDMPDNIRAYWKTAKVNTKTHVEAYEIYDVLINECKDIVLESGQSGGLYSAKNREEIASGEGKSFEDWVEEKFRKESFKIYNSDNDQFNLGESCLPDYSRF